MQEKTCQRATCYATMQFIYVNMQHYKADVHQNYVNTRDEYVNIGLKRIARQYNLIAYSHK